MRRLLKVILALGLPALTVLLFACTPKAPPPPPPAPSVNSGFVGNDACQPCHEAEFKSHEKTRHRHTLLAATKAVLGSLAPPPGKLPITGNALYEQDQLVIEMPQKDTGEPVPVPIDLALGSGKTGMTYLAVHDQGSVEIRQSYFPDLKAWKFTPGMEKYDEKVVGVSLDVPATIKCIACHAVSVPNGPLLPDRKFLGVGCESCHGPGVAHVDSMNKGETTPGAKIEGLVGASGEVLNNRCGTCHQTAESIEKDNLSKASTNRFQPFGLAQSECFKKSQGKLTCVTCHNPHEDASTDVKGYEKVCLSCHTTPKTVCKVNPKEKCISCHMPSRLTFPNAPLKVKMAEHFIKVFTPKELKAL